MSSNIAEIKERLDIVVLASQVSRLRKFGRSHRGLCPFHSEKTPSFYVYPEKNRFKCYGCGAEGSALDFFAQQNDITLGEAVKMLEAEFGLKRAAKPKRLPPLEKSDYGRIGLIAHAMRDLFYEDEALYLDIASGKIEEQVQIWESMIQSAPEGVVRQVAEDNCRYYVSLLQKVRSGCNERRAA